MKTQICSNHTQKARKRNQLRAHADGTFSVRIDDKWSHGLRELNQSQFLSLLPSDRERLVLREFFTGRSVTGSPVIISRSQPSEVV